MPDCQQERETAPTWAAAPQRHDKIPVSAKNSENGPHAARGRYGGFERRKRRKVVGQLKVIYEKDESLGSGQRFGQDLADAAAEGPGCGNPLTCCRSCRWWDRQSSPDWGECSRMPPTPVILDPQQHAIGCWPSTRENWWCGEWTLAVLKSVTLDEFTDRLQDRIAVTLEDLQE